MCIALIQPQASVPFDACDASPAVAAAATPIQHPTTKRRRIDSRIRNCSAPKTTTNMLKNVNFRFWQLSVQDQQQQKQQNIQRFLPLYCCCWCVCIFCLLTKGMLLYVKTKTTQNNLNFKIKNTHFFERSLLRPLVGFSYLVSGLLNLHTCWNAASAATTAEKSLTKHFEKSWRLLLKIVVIFMFSFFSFFFKSFHLAIIIA